MGALGMVTWSAYLSSKVVPLPSLHYASLHPSLLLLYPAKVAPPLYILHVAPPLSC